MDRLELHQKLTDILGSKNVYYQPPQSFRMSFPCIVYSRVKLGLTYADDGGYNYDSKYNIVVIYTNPDDDLVYKILLNFPMCSHDSHYVTDNLYHDAFSLYIR